MKNEGERTSYTDGEEAVRRLEMEAELPKAMFVEPDSLAQLFTAPDELSFEEHECYRSNIPGDELMGMGLSFTEYCENDIHRNMIAWSHDGGDAIFYLTNRFLYVFELDKVAQSPIVLIAQFERRGWIRKDSWLNLHSVGVGKEFLRWHKDKKIPMFLGG